MDGRRRTRSTHSEEEASPRREAVSFSRDFSALVRADRILALASATEEPARRSWSRSLAAEAASERKRVTASASLSKAAIVRRGGAERRRRESRGSEEQQI